MSKSQIYPNHSTSNLVVLKPSLDSDKINIYRHLAGKKYQVLTEFGTIHRWNRTENEDRKAL